MHHSIYHYCLAISLISSLSACSSAHQIHQGPQTLEKGRWAGSAGSYVNTPLATVAALSDAGREHLVDAYRDTAIQMDSTSLHRDLRALAAQSLDPLGMGTDLGISYGLGWGLELGARMSGGMVWEARWQFLRDSKLAGTIGAQYSSRSYELPSYLGKIQSLTDFQLERSDLVMPLTLGRVGSFVGIWGGPVVANTRLKYGFDPEGKVSVLTDGAPSKILPELAQTKTSFWSYGAHLGMSAGWKRVRGVLTFSAYTQDYPTLAAPGMDSLRLQGWTLIPYLGIEFR